MIAADTSTWIAFLDGSADEDTQLLDKFLEDRQFVLTELLSDRSCLSALPIASQKYDRRQLEQRGYGHKCKMRMLFSRGTTSVR
jgi:hypothetical protein